MDEITNDIVYDGKQYTLWNTKIEGSVVDDVTAFLDAKYVYVFCRNQKMDYIGLQIFSHHMEEVLNLFLQGDDCPGWAITNDPQNVINTLCESFWM
jgi:hypothetical protein